MALFGARPDPLDSFMNKSKNNWNDSVAEEGIPGYDAHADEHCANFTESPSKKITQHVPKLPKLDRKTPKKGSEAEKHLKKLRIELLGLWNQHKIPIHF